MGQCYKIIFCSVWLGVLVVILVRYANSPRGGLVIVAAGGSGFCETLQKAAESVLMSLVTPGVVRVSEQGICRPQGRWRRLMSVCLSVCMYVCLSVCMSARSVTVPIVLSFNRSTPSPCCDSDRHSGVK